MKTERALGNRWADAYRRRGYWALKIPAASTAGIPDWLLLGNGLELWEAKRVRESGLVAYNPKQLSAAQRFFQRMLKRYAPTSGGVVVLAEDGFVELAPRSALRPLSRWGFERARENY